MSEAKNLVEGVFLEGWASGITDDGRNPVLFVNFTDGRRFGVLMESAIAKQMGAALVQLSDKTASAAETKPH